MALDCLVLAWSCPFMWIIHQNLSRIFHLVQEQQSYHCLSDDEVTLNDTKTTRHQYYGGLWKVQIDKNEHIIPGWIETNSISVPDRVQPFVFRCVWWEIGSLCPCVVVETVDAKTIYIYTYIYIWLMWTVLQTAIMYVWYRKPLFIWWIWRNIYHKVWCILIWNFSYWYCNCPKTEIKSMTSSALTAML